MLFSALALFLIVLFAAFLVFHGMAGLSANIGWLFAVLAVVLPVLALFLGRRTMAPPR